MSDAPGAGPPDLEPEPGTGVHPLAKLAQGGKAAFARALVELEREPFSLANLDLLDAAWQARNGLTVGLTGPPGVGKSTLASALLRHWRAAGRRVAVLAVDPSSAASGGALLGDRTRIVTQPGDDGAFVRSLAARDRLGGLADLVPAAVTLAGTLFDIVLIETVGVGQSETEVRDLVDLLVLALQPGSGDSLQLMKSGIVETPDILVVTKADLGEPARRAWQEAMALVASRPMPRPPVLLLRGEEHASPEADGGAADGVAALAAAIDGLWMRGRSGAGREAQGRRWLERWVREEYGRRGLAHARARGLLEALPGGRSPFRAMAELAQTLEQPARG